MADPTILRAALLTNAAFSTLTGGIALGWSGPLAAWMELAEPAWLAGLGPSLLAFAALLIWVATRPSLDARLALGICAADAGWVVGSLGLLLLLPDAVGEGGRWLVAGCAVAVGGIALGQLLGIARLHRGDGTRGGHRSTLQQVRFVRAAPEALWPLLADLDGYHEVAPNLSFSRTLAGRGEGAVRECGDHEGGRWTERCVLWEQGHRFAMEVDTTADDYPYPLRTLRGEWAVAEAPGGSTVRMRFDLTLPGGLLGEVFAAVVLVPRFEPVIAAILDSWQARAEGAARPEPLTQVASS